MAGVKKEPPWEPISFFADTADERNRNIIVEEGLRLSDLTEQHGIAEAKQFLSQKGIDISKPSTDASLARDIDNFNIQ